jgi:hypothetical protein
VSNLFNQSSSFDDEDQPSNAPHTDESAVLEPPAYVSNVLAIRVYKGSYRNASIHDQTFEIGNIKMPFDCHNGILRVQVKCRWYGWKPDQSNIHIKLEGDWELIPNYSGEVAKNFVKGS